MTKIFENDSTILLTPENTQKAEYIFAVLSVDEKGNEGICGVENFPAVAMKEKTIDLAYQMIQDKLTQFDLKTKIIKVKFKRV